MAAIVSGLMTWAVARCYGSRSTLMVPIGGIVALVVVMWRNTGRVRNVRWA
jgi:hypothetical protein